MVSPATNHTGLRAPPGRSHATTTREVSVVLTAAPPQGPARTAVALQQAEVAIAVVPTADPVLREAQAIPVILLPPGVQITAVPVAVVPIVVRAAGHQAVPATEVREAVRLPGVQEVTEVLLAHRAPPGYVPQEAAAAGEITKIP
jgi:hypothetical protein